MKKIISFVSFLTVIIIFASSCNDQKTAQEMIQEEKKAIQRFVAKNNIKVLSTYPEDDVFAENEYYKHPDGLYIHVVDSGNGVRVRFADEVCVRYDKFHYFKTELEPTPVSPFQDPDYIIYGFNLSFGKYGCEGWMIPLSYVGDEALVDLIIPSNLGNQSDNQSFRPVFYKGLKYRIR